MKVIMIAGSHPRHMHIANILAAQSMLSGIVMEKREKMIRDIPDYLNQNERALYEKHFDLRMEAEEKYFDTKITPESLEVPFLEVERKELNSEAIYKFIKSRNAEVLISYGPGLLDQKIIGLFKEKAFNIHGGLSPWYKGSATMFWPFYFLEPNYVGMTIHHLSNHIDGGNIVHHSVPKLEYGDRMHEVACKTVIQTGEDLKVILGMMQQQKIFPGVEQRKNGKLFLIKDWRPEHLKLVYETYEDKIVDLFLNGEINRGNAPQLIKAF